MLKEFDKVRQEKTGYRRMFSDDKFDLYIWYKSRGAELLGFQLVYNKKTDTMKAFTWEAAHGFLHSTVDDEGWYNPTPILVENGIFNKNKIAREFEERSAEVDKDIRDLVMKKITEYPEKTR